MIDGKGNLVFKVIKGFRIRASCCRPEYQLVFNLEAARKLDLMVFINDARVGQTRCSKASPDVWKFGLNAVARHRPHSALQKLF